MSEFKGTKEEWLVSNCLVFANDYFQTHIALIPDSYNTEIKQANAKLISCAPEMLEMLERVLTAKFSCDEIKQLIKKATS